MVRRRGRNRTVLLLGFQQSSPIVWKRDEQLELGASALLNCSTCTEWKKMKGGFVSANRSTKSLQSLAIQLKEKKTKKHL